MSRTGFLTISLVLSGLALMTASCFRAQKPSATPGIIQEIPQSTIIPVVDVRKVYRALYPEEAVHYVGDETCVNCHGKECGEYSHSRHARTLRAVTTAEHAAIHKIKTDIVDPNLKFHYGVDVKDGKCVQTGTKSGAPRQMTADYVMGSGKNAETFFSITDGNTWVDLRLSYYTSIKKWDFTPGQGLDDRTFLRAAGVDQHGDQLENCLSCHSTYSLRTEKGIDPKLSRFGIGCERCHGPAKEHVESAMKSGPNALESLIHLENLKTATPARITEICGSCHRTSKNAPMNDPKTINGLARFEGPALDQSACFQKSGKLSCVTCHAPHADAETNPIKNDKICLSCHQSAPSSTPLFQAKTACKVNQKSDCSKCHMPAQTIATIPHTKYRNHFIKIWNQ
ncbi:MAG: multiheme c-type cytochrome [Chthonomonadales bacterium]